MTLLDRAGPVPALRPRRPRGLPWLRPGEGRVLGWWLLSRAGVFLLAWSAGYLFAQGPRLVPFLAAWNQWDVRHYLAVAATGYAGQPTGVPLEAFFPGLPLALRGLHALGLDYVLAGLLVSAVAGAVAVVALYRLGEQDGPGVGDRAVLLLLLAPGAVFLAAPYTEAPFLAFAVTAWLAARRGSWAVAGLLAAAATTTRVTGLFLAAALVVEFLTGGRPRRWAALPFLALPAVPLLLYAGYLRATTGDWLRWLHAQQEGWSRRFTNPVQAFEVTWRGAFDPGQPLLWQWSWRTEILAVLLGAAFLAWLLWRRRWSEGTYVGLSLAAYATSSWYFSVPRSLLLWFPLWLALARFTLRRPVAFAAYLALLAPFSVVSVLLFTTGHWAG